MSLLSNYIKKYPKKTKRLIGINYEHLQQLVKQAEVLDHQKQEEIEVQKVRLNKKGAGCKNKLSILDQILLTLVYLSQNHTFEYLGIEFEVSESAAHNIFRYWLIIIGELLPASLIEQVKKKESDYELVKEILTQYELIVDSEEQPVERPSDQTEQKKLSSGKKKNHTFKTQLTVLPNGEDIVDIKVGDPGPTSDISQFRARLSEFLPSQKFKGDKGYIGEKQISTPHKKPKKGELTEAQKDENKKFSAKRIYVEHVIRLLKIFRVAQERFRLNRQSYEGVIRTVCGLVRLRIGALILPA
jgi:hypothetical protein